MENGIKTVVDMGCGDWQFSQYIDWSGVQYSGYDIVSSVVAENEAKYSKPNIRFNLYSGDPTELPAADLLLAKDVLQHWSNSSIQNFLPNLSRYKVALITNCVNPAGETFNSEITDGDFRYLDLRQQPFLLDASEVFSFRQHRGLLKKLLMRPQWLKRVLMIRAATAG